MTWDIVAAPLLPVAVLTAAAIAALLVALLGFWAGSRAAWTRAGVLTALLLVLVNPSIREEDREPVPDTAVIIVDRSLSQTIANRDKTTEAALERLRERLDRMENLDLRIVETRGDAKGAGGSGTELFSALRAATSDLAPDTIAGVIFITDGQVHDVPGSAAALGFDAPVHTLLTGQRDEADRRLTIVRAPRFGIVDETLYMTLRVDDSGGAGSTSARVQMRVDGTKTQEFNVITGREHDLEFELAHGGNNVIEIEVEDGPAELTRINNRAVVAVNGIRDRLRVLLVSGEPHAGERTWRNLLKADPSVDLVHFTILRPMEKLHMAPVNELSLIEFPVRELFDEKLYDFDLIIFDRYQRRRVLLPKYFENMAHYVEKGGALLVAAGPAFSGQASVYRSALAGILPAQPSGNVLTGGYQPLITGEGARHPVTASLDGSGIGADGRVGKPKWGRWFRLIGSETLSGQKLMAGPGNQPLLVLDRVGEGRVAQLMSDHAWLWTRGFEGGGPQAELLRRLAHWLMKEPDLEEEELRAESQGMTLEVRRRTMSETAGPVTVRAPSGEEQELKLERTEPGLWTGSLETEEFGMYRVVDGALTAVAAVGPLNPREFADVRTTEDKMQPLARETDSGLYWVADKGGDVSLPTIRRVRPGRDRSGANWLALHDRNRYVVRAHKLTALLPPLAALLLCLGGLMWVWRRESQ